MKKVLSLEQLFAMVKLMCKCLSQQDQWGRKYQGWHIVYNLHQSQCYARTLGKFAMQHTVYYNSPLFGKYDK